MATRNCSRDVGLLLHAREHGDFYCIRVTASDRVRRPVLYTQSYTHACALLKCYARATRNRECRCGRSMNIVTSNKYCITKPRSELECVLECSKLVESRARHRLARSMNRTFARDEMV